VKSVAINEREVPGASYVTKATITLDNNCQSPGYALALTDFNYNVEINWVDLADVTASGYLLRYDPVNQTIRAFQQNGSTGPLVEVPNGTDLSAVTVMVLVKGR
jgi:hypothetical protein